jgi:hypothetical protein
MLKYNQIHVSTFIEFLWASTLTHRVESRFQDRGGILLVAPPASLKTSILAAIGKNAAGVMTLSDITVQALVQARDSIASKKIHTLMFYDLQKIYERRQDTAINIIGSIRALMCEGFTSASFEQQNILQVEARALVIAATTHSMYRARMPEWDETGFSRRWLYSMFSLSNPDAIVQSIMNDEPISLGTISTVHIPFNLSIPMAGKAGDEMELRKLLQGGGQRGEEVPLILLRKVLAVLRWKAKQQKKADYSLDIVREFGKSMRNPGAEIVL